jgi:osmotically-inducible protein OsmY
MLGQRAEDLTLTDEVQSTIFLRAAEAPKGRVDVNVEGGVIYLRGELDGAEQIRDVVAAANRVEGVRRVVNLLHMPAEPAPMKD